MAGKNEDSRSQKSVVTDESEMYDMMTHVALGPPGAGHCPEGRGRCGLSVSRDALPSKARWARAAGEAVRPLGAARKSYCSKGKAGLPGMGSPGPVDMP